MPIRRLTLLLAMLLLFTASARSEEGDDLVYIGRNATVYHRLDCPRLRFERPIARSEAVARYPGCPVCRPEERRPATAAHGGSEVAPSIPRTPTELPAPNAPVTGTTPTTEPIVATGPREGGGAGRWIGMAIGGTLGFLGGAAWAFADCPWFSDQSCGDGRVLLLTAGGAVGGYFLGKALSGGGGDRRAAIEESVERARQDFRDRQLSSTRSEATRPGT